jgi:hypothetical protein
LKFQLDTVCRVLLDRQWSVGELIAAILKYNNSKFFEELNQSNSPTLFEQIIRMDEKAPLVPVCTEL